MAGSSIKSVRGTRDLLPPETETWNFVEAAVRDGDNPKFYPWPVSRRGRTQARITLRRLARKVGEERIAPWKALYDRAPPDDEEQGATS